MQTHNPTVIILALLFSCFCFLSHLTFAVEYPKKILIAVTKDSHIESAFKPILSDAYGRLGIKTDYTTMNMLRASKMLSANLIDAEMLRMSGYINATDNQNLIKVNVPLISYGIYLFCAKEVTCSIKALNKKLGAIGIVKGDIQGSNIVSNSRGKGKPYYVNSREQLIQMIKKERLKYGITYLGDNVKNNFLSEINYLKKPLLRGKAYHFIHKHYQYLIKDLEKSLALSLKLMPPSKHKH